MLQIEKKWCQLFPDWIGGALSKLFRLFTSSKPEFKPYILYIGVANPAGKVQEGETCTPIGNWKVTANDMITL